LDQISGQVYRIRIGPDYSKKILDWIRIAKISNLFNTTCNLLVIGLAKFVSMNLFLVWQNTALSDYTLTTLFAAYLD